MIDKRQLDSFSLEIETGTQRVLDELQLVLPIEHEDVKLEAQASDFWSTCAATVQYFESVFSLLLLAGPEEVDRFIDSEISGILASLFEVQDSLDLDSFERASMLERLFSIGIARDLVSGAIGKDQGAGGNFSIDFDVIDRCRQITGTRTLSAIHAVWLGRNDMEVDFKPEDQTESNPTVFNEDPDVMLINLMSMLTGIARDPNDEFCQHGANAWYLVLIFWWALGVSRNSPTVASPDATSAYYLCRRLEVGVPSIPIDQSVVSELMIRSQEKLPEPN